MKRGIDHGLMLTDLDAAFWTIRNLGGFDPVPPELVSIDDSRLSDPRPILDGTVINDSVADDAGIDQFKLDLSGDVPSSFLGTGPTDAASGATAEFTSNRDTFNGYLSLDVTGKMPTGTAPLSGTGTLHVIDFVFPVDEVTTLPDASGTTRTFTGFWAAQQPDTWFGNTSGASAPPTFEEGRVFPSDLIPGFDASRIISGTFTTDQVPVAVGVGVDHSAGQVPAPGSTDTDSTAQPDDYLGRDMLYHPMVTLVDYQPLLPAPSITVQSYFGTGAYVSITTSTLGANLFYALGNGSFTEITGVGEQPSAPIFVPVGAVVTAYIAKSGFTNSNITSYTVPPNPLRLPGGGAG